MPDIFIIGDSLTRGYFGVPYTDRLITEHIHRGFDGAPLNELTLYAKRVLRGKRGILIIEGGANDLLSVYLRKTSHPYAAELTREVNPCIEDWKKRIAEDIRELSGQFSVALTTIPLISRSTLEEFNTLRERYDLAISEIARETGSALIDLGGALRAHTGSTASSYLPPSPASLIEDVEFIRSRPDGDMVLAEKRELPLSVDGIHPNRVGADLIAATFEAFFAQTLHVGPKF